jgi:uncharacterized cupredoxin-like copper-binding protein
VNLKRVLVPVVAAGAAVALASASGAGAATSVNVTAGKPSEFKFTLSKKTVAAGKVTFRVTNRGTVKHDLKIAGKKTKLIAPGKSASLTVTLKRGGNRYLCTVPGHADGGMKGTIRAR